jgi:hypothetical protein
MSGAPAAAGARSSASPPSASSRARASGPPPALRALVAAALLAAAVPGAPSGARAQSERVELTEACIDAAAARYGHDPVKFRALLDVEGGRVGETGPRNANGSHDLGPAQINDRVWVPHFAEIAGLPEARVRSLLLWDGCLNVEAAAYILALAVRRADGDVVRGYGYYHSATPEHHRRWVRLFLEAYARRGGAAGPRPPARADAPRAAQGPPLAAAPASSARPPAHGAGAPSARRPTPAELRLLRAVPGEG